VFYVTLRYLPILMYIAIERRVRGFILGKLMENVYLVEILAKTLTSGSRRLAIRLSITRYCKLDLKDPEAKAHLDRVKLEHKNLTKPQSDRQDGRIRIDYADSTYKACQSHTLPWVGNHGAAGEYIREDCERCRREKA